MPLLRRGTFRGTISFRGEGGYTEVHRRSVPGRILETFRQVCREPKEREPSGAEIPSGIQALYVAGGSGGKTFTFLATGPVPINPPPPPTGLPTVLFEVDYLAHRRGVLIDARSFEESFSPNFSVLGSVGTAIDATVVPPRPFEGSATFHLESPTTASWTGDLSVDLPGIGSLPLAGPGTVARFCEDTTCVGPPGGRRVGPR